MAVVLLQSKEKLTDFSSIQSWFPLVMVPGKVGMHRWTGVHCWLSAGLLVHSGHTHGEVSESWLWSCGLGQVFILRTPGPLSPAAMPVCSTPSSFLNLYRFYILSLTFSSQIPFITLIIKVFLQIHLLPFLSSLLKPLFHLSYTALSLIHTPGLLFRLSNETSTDLSVEVHSPVAAAPRCQTFIY